MAMSIGPPVASLAPPGVCQVGEEWVPLRLVDKVTLTHNVIKLVFALPDPTQPLRLSTCACLLARGTVNGEEVVRPYTPVSTNADVGTFTLMVKVYPQGKLSRYMQGLTAGESLSFKHIAGNVKIQYDPAKPGFGKKAVAMLAGGTGINPYIQALHAILGTEHDKTRVSLLFGAQLEEDLLAKDALEEWAASHEQLDVTYVLSNEPPSSSWKGPRGFINRELCLKHLPPPSSDCLIFVCGPPPMYDALCGPRGEKEVKGLLAELGYKAEQVYKF